jgi:hypothetical protein
MKKFLVTTAIIGLAVVANASSRFSQYPMIGGVAINNLCDSGNSFRTLHAVPVCQEWQNHVESGELYRGNEWTCVSSAQKVARISKTYSYRSCAEQVAQPDDGRFEYEYPVIAKCTRYTRAVRHFGRTFRVPVYEDKGELGLVMVDEVNYTIPSCR